ncbi:MAG TPA: tetratricopeptide repeat protein [Chitinophagaceae bacterium]
MKKLFWTFLSVSLLLACSDNTDGPNNVLNDPPFQSLTDSIHQFPKNPDLYYRRGVLLYQNSQPAYAAQDLRQAWALQPREEYALSMTTLLREKNADSAIVFIESALQKLPNSIALQVGLARGYQNKNQPEKALAIVDKIITDYPNQLDALVLKSELLQAQGKTKEALTALETAYGYAPFDASLGYELAYQYAEAGNPKALQLTDALIKADQTEKVAQAHYIKGVYYDKAGAESEAVKSYDEAIRANYNFMDAYRDKGILYYNQKKYSEALKTFQLALTISPAVAEFHYWIGKTEQARGNKQEAKLAYLRAYGLDKSITEAKDAADKL